LVENLLAIARSRGCKGIWVATEGDNSAARALYAKAGARMTDGIVVYDWDGAMDASAT
jgi:ribosomal protein S18 acetylase RimI-like enzyme